MLADTVELTELSNAGGTLKVLDGNIHDEFTENVDFSYILMNKSQGYPIDNTNAALGGQLRTRPEPFAMWGLFG